jgi:uncharacterized protein YwgA
MTSAKMDCGSFILITLLNAGGTFGSVTKLQKLAFLSIQETDIESFTEFKWHLYGPFSKEIEDTIDALHTQGILVEKEISRMNHFGDEYTVKQLSLTTKGRKLAENKIGEINECEKKAILATIDKYGDRPLAQILDYVYKAYDAKDF